MSRAVNPSFVMLWVQSQSHTIPEKHTSQNTCLRLRHICFHQTSLENMFHQTFKNLEGHATENQCRGAAGLSANIAIWNLVLIFSAPSHMCHHMYMLYFAFGRDTQWIGWIIGASVKKFYLLSHWAEHLSVPVLQSAQSGIT